jgi:hypothetical protein
MDTEINKIIKNYKKDTNFIKYLETVIENLTDLYKEMKINDVVPLNTIFYKNVCEIIDRISSNESDHFHYRIEDFILSQKEKELLKIFFKTISKSSVTYSKKEIYWSNGHDDGHFVDLHNYKVVYYINDEEIIFNIEYMDGTTALDAASIKFGDYLEYILADHSDQLGYYDDGYRRQFTIVNITKMSKVFESSNIETTLPIFYTWLILILTEELLSENENELDDPLCFDEISTELSELIDCFFETNS